MEVVQVKQHERGQERIVKQGVNTPVPLDKDVIQLTPRGIRQTKAGMTQCVRTRRKSRKCVNSWPS